MNKLYFDCKKHAENWIRDFKQLHGIVHELGKDARGWFVAWEIAK